MTALSTLVIDASALAASMAAVQAANPEKSPSDRPQTITVLDVRSADDYASGHILGAHRLDPTLLNRNAPPMNGLLPNAADVAAWSAQLGLEIGSTLVVYDGGKSTAAARALWVLNVYGFTNVHWLNGGLPIWVSSGQPITSEVTPAPSVTSIPTLTANSELVLTNKALKAQISVEAHNHQIVDARTKGEYEGRDVRSERGGHMPGAVHYEWLDMFQSDGTLQPENELRAALAQRQLEQDVPAIVYCQSHQRSAMTYVVLKHLGYKHVSALDGAWSNWGNDPTAPIDI